MLDQTTASDPATGAAVPIEEAQLERRGGRRGTLAPSLAHLHRTAR